MANQTAQLPDASTLTWTIWATNAAAFGACIVQLLEFIDNIPDEIVYLWRMPFKPVTYVYLWCRYFPFCAQVVNILMSHLNRTLNRADICFIGFTLKFVTAQIMTTSIEIIMIIRVHALYSRSRRVGIFLALVWVSGACFEIYGVTSLILDFGPGPTGTLCIPKACGKREIAFLFIGCCTTQIVLLSMTLFKVVAHNRQIGWLRTPLVSLMLRDGIGTFLSLAVAVVVVVVFEVMRESTSISWSTNLVWNAEFAWFTSLVSIIGCRLVLNMRKLGVGAKQRRRSENSESDSTQAIEFTSIFESDDFSIGSNGAFSSKDEHLEPGWSL